MLLSARHKKLILPFRDDVSNIISTSTPFDYKGEQMLAVPHGPAEVKLLRNLGLSAPDPILSQYDWAGDTPFDSQKTTAAMLSTEPRAYVLSGMGVGKTRAALYAFDYLKEQGVARTMLVVAPLSTLTTVWEREIFTTFPHLTSIVLHGTRPVRHKRLAEPHDIYIINHDGVGVVKEALAKKELSVICLDEAAAYRNARTKRWKDVMPLVRAAPFAWGLTGSPTPNAPTDAYGQVKLLTPQRIRPSFRAFQQQTMHQVTQFKWVPKRDANEYVHSVMQPSVRFSLDECHDLPPVTFSTRECAPDKGQAKAYKQLMDQYAMDIAEKRLTVVNEGARLNKLLQVGCGFAYDEEGKGMYVAARNRMKLALEIIGQAEKKVIVFAPYKWAVRMIDHVVKNVYTTATITGDTTKAERDKIFASFKKSRDPHVLIAHPGCMSHGLTLTEASCILWYAPVHSNETWEQANARIRRPGQDCHAHIICIESTDIERKVFKRLRRKEKMQGVLLDMFRQQETGYGKD